MTGRTLTSRGLSESFAVSWTVVASGSAAVLLLGTGRDRAELVVQLSDGTVAMYV
jgi:hypothetical protein